jgi:hypothetical protein
LENTSDSPADLDYGRSTDPGKEVSDVLESSDDILRYTVSGAMIGDYLLGSGQENPVNASEAESEAETEAEISGEMLMDEPLEALVPSYYSEQIQSNARLIIEKRTITTERQGNLRFRMEADGPVHIFSMRLNGVECLWSYDDGSIVLENAADRAENCITCLLIYEEKIAVPELVLS